MKTGNQIPIPTGLSGSEIDSKAPSGSGASTWDDISGKPSTFTPTPHAHAIADITGLQLALDGKQATLISGTNIKTVNGSSILGGGDLSINTSISLSTAQAFATAETTISSATYSDITGCSISLTAGTWMIFAHVVARNANTIIQVFAAITDSSNTVIAESAISRPASGTASLNSPISTSWQAIVTPSATTTYKLRGARGLTTHTGSWIAMDGNGVNTTNHASNNSDKGTSIIAIRISEPVV